MSKSRLNPPFIEEEFDSLIGRCCKDALMKSLNGAFIGILTSSFLTKRRSWPIWLGFGFGLGFAYTSCNIELRSLTSTAD